MGFYLCNVITGVSAFSVRTEKLNNACFLGAGSHSVLCSNRFVKRAGNRGFQGLLAWFLKAALEGSPMVLCARAEHCPARVHGV